jgi:hypothetical protein
MQVFTPDHSLNAHYAWLLERLVLYLLHSDGYEEPVHSLFYILVLDSLLLLLYLCVMIC